MDGGGCCGAGMWGTGDGGGRARGASASPKRADGRVVSEGEQARGPARLAAPGSEPTLVRVGPHNKSRLRVLTAAAPRMRAARWRLRAARPRDNPSQGLAGVEPRVESRGPPELLGGRAVVFQVLEYRCPGAGRTRHMRSPPPRQAACATGAGHQRAICLLSRGRDGGAVRYVACTPTRMCSSEFKTSRRRPTQCVASEPGTGQRAASWRLREICRERLRKRGERFCGVKPRCCCQALAKLGKAQTTGCSAGRGWRRRHLGSAVEHGGSAA